MIQRFLFGLAAAVLATSLPALASPAQVGNSAPDFALKTLDGKAVSLANYRGKTLVLNVWGSWCPPCRLEQPDLNRESIAMRGKNVVFLGIDTTEKVPLVRAFVAAKGIPYAQAVDTDLAFSKAYDIRNYPTTLVIDPHGIIRARHANNILPTPQLHAYIVAAMQGKTAPVISEQQRKIDALLEPTQYRFDGDSGLASATIYRAAKAIDDAEVLLDEDEVDPTKDTDLPKTRAAEAALRDRTIVTLVPLAKIDSDQTLLARLQGDASAERGDWSTAASAYDRAIAIAPSDRASLTGASYAYGQRGEYDRVIVLDTTIAAQAPDAEAEVALGRAYGKASDFVRAYAAFDRAIAITDGLPPSPSRDRLVTWVHLYFGRVASSNHDVGKARTEFAQTADRAQHLASSAARALYTEEAQEATVALDLGERAASASVSLAPWTGADLPGSIPSTLKYRLVATGPAGKTMTLRASGLPKGWVASFCTDRVCAPNRVVFAVPASGVKVIEFQVVPDGPRPAVNPTVTIDANAGTTYARTATIVAVR